MPEPPSYDLFVSYAEADSAWVEGYLLAALEQAGVRCMYESAFALGVPRLLEFERSIQQSKRTLLVISPNYLADGLNEFIATLGQSYGQDTNTWPVIPLIRQAVPLPPRLGMLVGLRATNEKEQESAIAQLCADLKRPLPAPAPPPDCPYPGMKPFGLGDRDRFFGRDQEIEELLGCLRLHPFITVIGPSGSGKSSLVFAGLIPALQESRLFGSGGWRMQSMRPGEAPETTLRQLLTEGAQEDARLLLVVDQFEELFTLAKEEAVSFQESLLKLAKTPNVYLVLTVRADFYADLMTSLLWQEIQNYRLEVVPLDETGLQQAILKPAEAVGVFVEAALVEKLVTDAAGEPGVLPLIQETLVLLWQRLERRFLPLRAYEALILPRTAYGGQETGQKTGLQVAISRRADQAIRELTNNPEKQQAIARRIFLRLIQFGEGRADTRRQQSVESLMSVTDEPALFNQTLAHLVSCRLLTPSGDDRNSIRKIDIAHEALIVCWPTLRQWITERREVEQTRRRLTASAEEWVRFGRGSGGLLDKVELAEAQRWLSSPDAVDLGYDESLPAFVKTSQDAIEAAEQRELQLIRERLEQEKKAGRIARRLNWIASISIVLLAGLTTFAFMKSDEAVKNRKQAEQQALLAQVKNIETLIASNQRLKALVEALRVAKFLRETPGEKQSSRTLVTALQLQEAIDGIKERNQLEGHKNWVLGVDVSPNGQIIASASQDNTIKLWKADGSLITTLKDPSLRDQGEVAHAASVLEVNFSPDGQTLASASMDNTVKIWNVADGKLLKTFSDSNWISSVSFSPNEQIVATACADKTVKIWSLNHDQPPKVLQGHTDTVMDVSFNKEGNLLASVSKDGSVRLWNTRTWKLQRIFQTPGAQIYGVSFSPDSRLIASSSGDSPIRLWTLNSSTPTKPELVKKSGLNVRFSQDGQTIAAAGQDGVIRLLNKKGVPLEELRGHQQSAGTVRFNPTDSNMLVSGSLDGTIRVWDRRGIPSPNHKLANKVSKLAFNPVNTNVINLASGHEDGTIRLWKQNGTLIRELKEHKDYVSSMSFSSNGRMLASASSDNTVKLWDLSTQVSKTLTGHNKPVTAVSFSPDGRLVASASQDKTIKLWTTAEGQLQNTLEGHKDWVNSLNFSSDGKLIASGSSDGTVKLWTSDGKLVQTLDGIHGSVKFSPDSQLLAATSGETVRLWRRRGDSFEAFEKPLKGHIDSVLSISFTPDGQVLASAGADNVVKFWSLDGILLYTFRSSKNINGDEMGISEIVFSTDGKTLAFVNFDGSATLRTLDSNDLIAHGCDWVQSYLKTNSTVSERDRHICDGIEN